MYRKNLPERHNMIHEVFNAHFDNDGNICYMNGDGMGEYVIASKFFRFIPNTPHMGRLEIYHTSFPSIMLVSFNMEHDYEWFEEDMADMVARYIERYC